MHVKVNGTRLWFDVDGLSLVTDGPEMRKRPTVLLVHGGPGGFDHSYFKPDFSRLTGVAQVIYLDLRSHGRSDRQDDWDYALAGDDIRAFCNQMGVTAPVVLGHSFGGPSSATGCRPRRNDPASKPIENWLRSVASSSRTLTWSTSYQPSIAPRW